MGSRAIDVVLGRRTSRLRWLVLLPCVVALLFVGHAAEDSGAVGAAPYMAIIILSVWYVVRPTLLAWALLFATFLSYGLLVASRPDGNAQGEWVLFMSLGFIPAILLWVARPRPAA
jgi:hypothetical protein